MILYHGSDVEVKEPILIKNQRLNHRKGSPEEEKYDVVIGPVANDQTSPVIDLFIDGMYDEEEAIRRLLPQKLKDQYTFKTERAIALLHFTEVNRV